MAASGEAGDRIDARASLPGGRAGLTGLGDVELLPAHRGVLSACAEQAGGTPAWRARKRAEARDLFALMTMAPWRLRLRGIDLRETLRAMFLLSVPVPCRSEAAGAAVTLADHALIAIRYTQEALLLSQPGHAFVQILEPRDVFHPNVSRGDPQALCLGERLPAGIPVRELVLMTYGALALQTVTLDEMDPGGVMNTEAARYWQQSITRIPLTRTPFLGNEAQG